MTALDLFTPRVPRESFHPNFAALVNEEDDAVRAVLRDWANGFIDRDGKFVQEFQRTFNSSWWELYLHAVLKSLGLRLDFDFAAPDFVMPDSGLAIEATIASHAQGAMPEWQKTIKVLTRRDPIGGRYLEQLARLSNSLDAKLRRYRKRYRYLPRVGDLAFVIAVQNFGTPDFFQLGDVAMQRLLYDVWDENEFLKDGKTPLPTGLFRDARMRDVSAVLYSSVATFGKARALSASKGDFVFQAIRIRDNIEPIVIGAKLADYRESLRDGLRLFHNPFAERPVPEGIFDVADIRQFWFRDGDVESTCSPDGDLCMRQVMRITSSP